MEKQYSRFSLCESIAQIFLKCIILAMNYIKKFTKRVFVCEGNRMHDFFFIVLLFLLFLSFFSTIVWWTWLNFNYIFTSLIYHFSLHFYFGLFNLMRKNIKRVLALQFFPPSYFFYFFIFFCISLILNVFRSPQINNKIPNSYKMFYFFSPWFSLVSSIVFFRASEWENNIL